MKVVISDATPLNYLILIGEIGALASLFEDEAKSEFTLRVDSFSYLGEAETLTILNP